ncbi:FtsW/RodA/SpoVE family cell cycle protein, partial [Corynebacterium striatum]
MTATRPQTPASKTLGQRVQEIRQHYRAQPGLDYQLLRIIIFSLIGIGVLMAFSASMATSFTETSNVWSEAIRQCLLVFGGLVLFWLALRISPYTLRKLVPWLLLLSILLLIAVLIP